MSRSLNKATLIGNVGSEPEIRTTQGGTRVAKVSLATTRQWKGRDGSKQEKTEWHRLVLWDKLAEIAEQYIHKGDRLYVEGEIEYSQSEDDRGVTRYWTDINVRQLIMLGSPNGGGNGNGGGGRNSHDAPAGSTRTQQRPSDPWDDDDDDLPF